MPFASPSAPNRKPGRRVFVRTTVPLVERALSVVILCLLGGIGGAVWIKGQHFDPARFSPRADALKSTVPGGEGNGGTRPGAGYAKRVTVPSVPSVQAGEAEPPGGAESIESVELSGAPPGAVPEKSEPLDVNLPDAPPMGETEFYNPDNLFEKIDGRAPAYLGFNFRQLRCRAFAVAGVEGSYVDLYEYRMDTPVDAFGIFALERDPHGRPVDFAPDGYASGMGFFFRQGPVYLQAIASDQNAKTLALAQAVAEARARAIPADNTGLEAARRLPADGMIPGSLGFVRENAQGQALLKNVFQAAYDFDGKKLPFFLMTTTPESADEAWKSYQNYCARFGRASALPDVRGARVFAGETFGKTKVVYRRAGEIGGVYDADDPEKARAFVEKYLRGEIK
jgi:hypothetical protein